MANLEDENRDLKEKNSELAMELQSFKILCAQKDKEKLELTKEVNELRLKISRLRSGGAAQARKLDAGLQAASEQALSHLVQASGAVARTIELAKQYIQDRRELESASPRWSNIGNPSAEKIHKVPPMMLGGQSIQPVVSLSRTMLSNRSITRSPNQSSSGVTHRPLPMRMMQDVYIPLTRIDANDLQAQNLDGEDAGGEASVEDFGLEDNSDQVGVEPEETSDGLLRYEEEADEFDESERLDAVLEESAEGEGIMLRQSQATPHLEDIATTPPRQSPENPLEGPSWLLDVVEARAQQELARTTTNFEADSTTPCDRDLLAPRAASVADNRDTEMLAFTPTVRRRKRTSSARVSSPHGQLSDSRILQVVVAKLRAPSDDAGGSGDSSPPKRASVSRRSSVKERLKTPHHKTEVNESPNSAGPSGLACETENTHTNLTSRRPRRRESTYSRYSPSDYQSRSVSRNNSRSQSRMDDSDSESAEDQPKTRRQRKPVSYKEKPLNRKLRR